MTDAAGNVTTYGYDATGQLTQVTLPGGQTITYVYNAAGDRTEVINNGTPTSYSSNADNEITQVGSTTYTYDANGNLHTVTDASGTTTYTYNDLNQLVSITAPDGTVTTFQYSPLGFLVGQNVNGTQTNYLVDPTGLGNVVASYNGSGSLIADYIYGLGLVSQTGPSGTGYYDFDASGNTVGITGSSGTYVNQYSYLPFGETTTVSAAVAEPVHVRRTVRRDADRHGPVLHAGPRLHAGHGAVPEQRPDRALAAETPTSAGTSATIRSNLIDPTVGTLTRPNGRGLTFGRLRNGPRCLEPGQMQAGAVDRSTANFQHDTGEWSQWIQGLDAAASPDRKPLTAGSIRIGRRRRRNTTLQWLPGEFGFTPGFGQFRWRRPLDPGQHTVGQSNLSAVRTLRPAAALVPRYGGSTQSHNADSHDPNALIGPAGFGTQNFIQPTGTWPYTVDFENDGSVAAQDVTVTEQLDPNLDWSTFQLGSFGFGPINVTIPAGLTQYQTTVAYQNTDGSSLNVQVALDFNVQTGLLTVTFTSLDPLTGQAPTGVFDGFLPPTTAAASARATSSTRSSPRPAWPPAPPSTSRRRSSSTPTRRSTRHRSSTPSTPARRPAVWPPLPATESSTSFTVSWSGSDGDGSGIASYNVYVSDDGGPFTL